MVVDMMRQTMTVSTVGRNKRREQEVRIVALLDFSGLFELRGPSLSFSFQMARNPAATFALCTELTSASA